MEGHAAEGKGGEASDATVPSTVKTGEGERAGALRRSKLLGEPAVVRLELLHTKTPVEGCELSPFVLLRDVNGDQRTAEAMEARSKGALSAQYRWYRREYQFECIKTGLPATVECLEVSRAATVLFAGDAAALHKISALGFFHRAEEIRDSWPTIRDLQYKAEQARVQAGERERGARPQSAAALDEARDRALQVEVPPPNESTLQECGFVRNYAPSARDVGHTLRLECRYVWKPPSGGVHIGTPMATDTLPTRPFAPSAPERRMQLCVGDGGDYSVRERRSSGESNCFPLRVMSYNCLAELYASSDLYSYCPDWALAWNYRRRNLLREIMSLEADVICLQEIQADHFEEHFKPALRRIGYEGVFKAKLREAMGRKGKVDGCATFYRSDRFKLAEVYDVEYSSIARERVKEKRLLNRLVKDNVAHLVVLEWGNTGCRVCVANTHIFWDPDQTDVKLFQVDTFLQEAEEFISARNIPLIVAGDFNSMPDSSIYELIVHNEVSGQRGDIGEGMMEILKVSPCQHNLLLRSAYGLGGEYSEPSYTNYTGHFVGTLDFLFFTPDSIIPVGTLEILDETRLLAEGDTALPSPRWSSDHVAIMADFDVYMMRSP